MAIHSKNLNSRSLFLPFLLTAFLLATIGFVAAPQPAGAVTLEVWSVFPEHTPQTDDLKAIAQAFEVKHPDITVTIRYPAALGDNLQLGVITGTAPDVTFTNGGIISNSTTFGALLEPLTPLMERDGVADDYILGALQSYGTWKDVTYAVPYLIDPNFAVVINRDHFRERGLDPDFAPGSPEELIDAHRALTRRNAQGNLTHVGIVPWRMYGVHTALLNWSLAFSGSQLTDGERYTLDDPGVMDALEWLVEFSETFDGAELDAFTFGFAKYDLNHIGMQPLVSVDAAHAVQTFPDIDYGLTWLPTREGGVAPVWLGGHWLGIPRGAKHKEEAWEFIKFATLDPEAIALSISSRFAGAKNAYTSGAYDVTEFDRVMHPDIARLFSFYASLVLDAQPILEAPVWYVQEMMAELREIIVTRDIPPSEIVGFNELLNNRLAAEMNDTP